MTDAHSASSTQNSKFIKAPPEALYRAFTDPAALAVWLAPGDMTGEVHSFDGRVGGGYRMSLYYLHPKKPSAARVQKGKIDLRPGLWSLRPLQESSRRSPLIRPIRPSRER
ncbi:MAG: SRPBCC domain-containing protein [Nitrososphaera sp.]|nr:SRPBCC domain-containing protein [Nitrososphaera sp.]